MPYGKIQSFLTVKGKTKTVKADHDSKTVFDWQNALADSAILAAITFFTGLLGINAAGVETVKACSAAGISASLQFFSVLALKRGLKQNSSGE